MTEHGNRWFTLPTGALLWGDGSGGSTLAGILLWSSSAHEERKEALDALVELAKRGHEVEALRTVEPTADENDADYPHTSTCDGCSEGPKPVRLMDDDSQAWSCRDCDAIEDAGVAAAGRAAIDAYYAARARAALVREQTESHTRTTTASLSAAGESSGPDFCAECSKAANDWVQWPCPAVREQTEETCPGCGNTITDFDRCSEGSGFCVGCCPQCTANHEGSDRAE